MPSGPAFTLKWYASLLSNDRVLEALTNSLLIASITTVVTTIMGTFAAIALHRYQYRSKTVLNSLLYLPILIPEIVMGLSLLILFPSSVFPFGKPTLIVAHITFCLSFVIITVGARLEGSRQDIEEAASDLYATPLQTFRYVTLPMIAPGIIAGALMAFLPFPSMTLSSASLWRALIRRPCPLYIYAMVKRGISPQINALSTCMMLVTVSLVVVSQLLQMKSLHDTRKE